MYYLAYMLRRQAAVDSRFTGSAAGADQLYLLRWWQPGSKPCVQGTNWGIQDLAFCPKINPIDAATNTWAEW